MIDFAEIEEGWRPRRTPAVVVERGVSVVGEAVERRSESAARRVRRAGDDCCCACDPALMEGFGRQLGDGLRHVPPNLHAATLSFPARLLTYVNAKCGGRGPVAYVRAGVSKQIYSRIVAWDDEKADKRTVMKFCIGLQLNMSEAELLMKSAGYAFSNTLPEDMAFVFAIEHGIHDINDVEEMLIRSGLPGLGLKV